MKQPKSIFTLLLFIFSSCFSINLYCQSLIKNDGYLIKLNNDTIKGLIEYADQNINPESIRVYGDNIDEVFNADELKEVFIPAKTKFVSTNLRYPSNPFKLDQLTESKEIIWKEKVVMLKSLIEGEVSLYEFIDEIGKKHFVIYTPKEGYLSLILLKYLENRQVATSSTYRNQLKRVLENVDQFYTDINRANYSQSNLIKLIEKYHEKKGSVITYKSPSEPLGIEMSFKAGVSITNHSLNQVKTVNQNIKFNPELNVDYILPRYNRNWSFFTGLGLRSYEVPLEIYNRGTEQLNYIKLFTGVRKKIFEKKAMISIGMSNANLINKIDDQMRTYEAGLFIGLGLNLENVSINLRSETSNGYSRSLNNATVVRTIYLSIGYTFFRKN